MAAAARHCRPRLVCGAAGAQQATEDFTVGDIRVEGLQRISEGTVFNYLPVNIGDRLDQRHVQEAIRALFGTGFFSDIEIPPRRLRRSSSWCASARPSRASSSRQQGHQDRGPAEVAARRGTRLGKTFDRSCSRKCAGS
jgi:outer membrane protein insertion porin family